MGFYCVLIVSAGLTFNKKILEVVLEMTLVLQKIKRRSKMYHFMKFASMMVLT